MASNAPYQPTRRTRYIMERNLMKLPYSKKVPFRMHDGHSELLITGRVKSSPTEFEIIIGAAREDNESVFFNMHQRWKEDRTEFYHYIDDDFSEVISWMNFSEYVHFPSLKPESDFTISISTVQEDPSKEVFHFKVRVNDEPVVMVLYSDSVDIDFAEVMIKSQNNDINVTLVQLDVTD